MNSGISIRNSCSSPGKRSLFLDKDNSREDETTKVVLIYELEIGREDLMIN